jgi:signal transduction histidine kinase
MTDLIDSLRELSYQRSAITPTRTRLDQVIRRAIEAIHSKPEFRDTRIVLSSSGDLEGMFDARKLERVFFNLILNGCESMAEAEDSIVVDAKHTATGFEIRVHDKGRGIPSNIRDSLFDPFVSFGKPNGTGLGLAIVSKIVQDHSGNVSVEQTSDSGTTVLVRLPLAEQSVADRAISPIR